MSQFNHCLQISFHIVPVATENSTDIANEIKFLSTIHQSLLRFRDFCRGAVAAVRKSDHRAGFYTGAVQNLGTTLEIMRLDTNTARLVNDRHATTSFEVREGQGWLEQ